MADDTRPLILIVEDNADTREVLGRILAMQGYHVVTARDGLDAFGYLGSGIMPHAIILDIAMPIMDGITFSQRMRADERWAHIPVIVYTALRERSISTAHAVFRKGTDDPSRLLALVAQLCDAKH